MKIAISNQRSYSIRPNADETSVVSFSSPCEEILNLCFTFDGAFLIVVENGKVSVHDMATTEIVWCFKRIPVSIASFMSNTSKNFCSLSATACDDVFMFTERNTVVICEIGERKERLRIFQSQQFFEAAISPNGKTVGALFSNFLRLWSIDDTETCRVSYNFSDGHIQTFDSQLKFNDDASMAVVVRGPFISIIDVHKRELIRKFGEVECILSANISVSNPCEILVLTATLLYVQATTYNIHNVYGDTISMSNKFAADYAEDAVVVTGAGNQIVICCTPPPILTTRGLSKVKELWVKEFDANTGALLSEWATPYEASGKHGCRVAVSVPPSILM